MEQAKFEELFKDFCKAGVQLDKATYENNGGYIPRNVEVSFTNNAILHFIDQYKQIMTEFFTRAGITKVMFRYQICYNSLYVGGMFKFKDSFYRFAVTIAYYYLMNNNIRMEIIPVCESYDEEKKITKYVSVWRRQKNYTLTLNLDTLNNFRLPKVAKCKVGDVVTIKDRWQKRRRLGRVIGIHVCGPIYYTVKYLEKLGSTNSWITEGKLIKLKHGL